LDTPLLGAFLDHLEQKRDNSARTRNVRLAAIHSFFRYVALHAPEYSGLAQRVLAMPSKRYVRRPICFLTPVELNALLDAPSLSTWSGRRDRAPVAASRPNGNACVRTHWLALRERRPRRWRSRTVLGQRTQDKMYSASQRDGQRSA